MGAHACRLVLTSGHLDGKAFDLPSEGVLRLGSATGAHIQLPIPGVLPAHCFIKGQAGRYALVVQDQAAELQINGMPTRRKLLEPGDTIRLGDAVLLFEAAQTDPFVGATVGGYRIEELLGRGGMGTVYKATQLSLERLVAFKILSPELTRDKEFVREFLSEARAAAKLNHPNVVQIYDAGAVPLASLPPEGAAAYAVPDSPPAPAAGSPPASAPASSPAPAPEEAEPSLFFFSMEYLPGGTLAELLDREGKLGLVKVLEIGRDTARALVWAEEQGIVHRDIKPDNLLFAADGAVKVADLGIAAEPHAKKQETAGKRPRAVGSPRYMAPEQAAGKPVDNRADIYALGSTLYRVLAGKPPFEGKTASEILRAKLSADPPPIDTLVPEVPASMVSLLNRMMARDPDGRPGTCVEVLSDIEECLDRARGGPRPEPARERVGVAGGRRRRRRRAGASGAPLYVETLGGQVTLAVSGLMILSSVVWAVVWKPPEAVSPDSLIVVEAGEGTPDSDPDRAHKPPGGDEDPEPVRIRSDKTEKSGGAESAALRKLVAISKDWQTGIFDTKRTVERIEAFKKEHPGPPFQEKAEALVETIRQTRVQNGQRALALLLPKDVTPFVERGRFKDAVAKLDSLAANYPEIENAIAAEVKKIEEAASVVWSQAELEADKQVETGDHKGAVERLRQAATELSPGAARRASEKIAAVEKAEKDYGELLKKFGELAGQVEDAALALEFERAVSVATGIPAVTHPVLAWRRTILLEETLRAREAWEALKAGVARKVAAGAASEVAFEPGGAAAALKFKSLDGCALGVELAGGRLEGRDLFAARTRDLLAMVAEGTGGGAAAPAVRVLEGLGLLLLLRQGPERAKEVLLDPRLGPEKLEAYKLRLQEDEGPFLARAPRAAQARVQQLKGRAASPGVVAQWEALASGLAATIASARKLPGYATARQGLSAAFIAARLEALKAAGPNALFAGKVESYKAEDGMVELLYDFNTEDELKDFLPVKGTSSEREFTADKSVKFLGEFRFLKGDVFRNRLSVSVKVPAGGYTPQAPNVNVALWTRDGDRLSPAGAADGRNAAAAQPEDTEQLEGMPDDYYVFALGYKAAVFNRRMRAYEYLSLRGAQNSILMPANAVIGGLRGARLHSVAEDDCIWAQQLKNPRGPQSLKVAMSGKPGELPVLTIGGRAAPLKESKGLDLLKRNDPYLGSVTVFTNGEVVEYDSIALAGELNPAWLEAQFRGTAEKELRKLDPGGPAAGGAAAAAGGNGGAAGNGGAGAANDGAKAEGKKKKAAPRPVEPLPEPAAEG